MPRFAYLVGEVRCPQRKVVTVEGWIFAENLQPFVELLAFLAGYRLYDVEYDWVAIEHGIKETDVDAGKWCTYAFAGTQPLTLHVAQDEGSNVVHVRVTSEAAITADLAAQLELLVMVCQDYTIAGRGSRPVR
jgi:hypothetical protein